jgi:tetratricopeptide (TPR) repeat protein
MTHVPPFRGRTTALTTLLTLALLLVASWATAQIPGDMRGKIFDENDNPLEDVTITITDSERPDFEQVVTSTKGGRFKILLANAIVPYTFKLSKPGYQDLTLGNVKIPARQTTNRNFKLTSDAGAVAAAQAGGATDIDPEAAAKGDAAEVFNKGVAAYNGGDLGTAETLFLSAIEKQSDLGVAHAALGRLYLKKKEYAKAVASADKAVALDTDLDSMNQVLYASHSALGHADEAAAALGKLKTADPEKAALNIFNEAAEAYNNGEIEEARKGLVQVLSLNPDHGKANYLMGLVYLNEGDNAKAKEHLEKFLTLSPNDPDAATAKEMLGYLNG